MCIASFQRVAEENIRSETSGTLRDAAIVTDANSIVMFEVTDLLTGKHYSVKDKGSYYELQLPTRNGPVIVKLDMQTDLIKAADEILNQLVM